MKTPTELNDTSRIGITDRKHKKKNNQTYIAGAILIATILGLLYIGMMIERSRQETPLPANEACYKAAHDQKSQLQASVNAQFGVPVPEGTPSADQVTQLLKDCDVSRNVTTVNVATK